MKYIKRIISIFVFLVILAALLYYINGILLIKRSDGITPMQNFYVQKDNSIDVLLLGSSHTGMNLDTEVLWSEYGISSYALWGSMQPFWNTYYFLIEALKTQTPKVVVLDVYAATFDFEYSDDARQVTNTAGMKLSLNKWNAIKKSAPQNRWFDLLTGFPLYHSRYDEITQDDFQHFPWSGNLIDNKGTGCRYGTNGNVVIEDVSDNFEIADIHGKEKNYLVKIIELCNTKNIPLVLIKTPTFNRIKEQPFYNTVSEIAKQYNIPFYNFNLMDSETGFNVEDYWTDGSHINTNGSRKITSYLGEILSLEYNLVDHRGNPKYSSWDTNSIMIQNNYISQITDTKLYFEELKRNDRSILLIKNSSWDTTAAYKKLLKGMEILEIDTQEILQSSGGDWFLSSTQQGTFENKYDGKMYSEFFYDNTVFSVDFQNGSGVIIGGEKVYNLDKKGIICIVYDKNTSKCIDVATFLVKNDFTLVHSLDKINK